MWSPVVFSLRRRALVFQADSKSIKIQPSPAGTEQRPSKESPWILLDLLVGNERFQRVMLTPRSFFLFSGFLARRTKLRRRVRARGPASRVARALSIDGPMARRTLARVSIFRKHLLKKSARARIPAGRRLVALPPYPPLAERLHQAQISASLGEAVTGAGPGGKRWRAANPSP